MSRNEPCASKVLAQGSLRDIKNNEHVIEAYLGTGLKNKEKNVVQ